MLGHVLITLVFLYTPSAVVGQLDFSAAHNLSSLAGTWSTGSGKVSTGAVSERERLFLEPWSDKLIGIRATSEHVLYVSQDNGRVIFIVSLWSYKHLPMEDLKHEKQYR